jgi:hypothetical protein
MNVSDLKPEDGDNWLFGLRPPRFRVILVTWFVLVTLAVLVISRGLSNLRERAELDRFYEEVQRLGGYVSQWGVDQETGGPELHVLFDGADIGDSEFERLARMPAFKHVLTLHLEGTRLSDRGLDLLRNNSGISVLNVAGTKITDKGMEAIASMPRLNSLDVSRTDFTDLGLNTLIRDKKSQSLFDLSVVDTKASEKSILKIKENNREIHSAP